MPSVAAGSPVVDPGPDGEWARWRARALCLALVFPLAFSALAQEAAEPAADPLDEFRARYEAVRAEAFEPVYQLKASYAERLHEQLEAARAEGDLDLVQAVLAEIAWVEGRGDMRADVGFSELLRLRRLYLTALQERERERAERLETLAERSGEALAAMERDYTRAGRIDRAQETRAFGDEMRDEASRLKTAMEVGSPLGLKEGETVLWALSGNDDFRTALGCEAREAGGTWTLTSPVEQRGHVRSPKEISPPFRISTLATTESGDLRFYYGHEQAMEFVLFNWTRNPTILRMADPSGQQGIQSVPDQGFLEVGRTYLIEVVVEERKIEVFVDGELRGTRGVDLKGYRGAVGIGPFGTVTLPARMSMEHFVVIRPKG